MTRASARRLLLLYGAGAALVLAGAAMAAWSGLVQRERAPRKLGTDRPVNAGARDPGDLSAHNSPSLARNPRDPRNLVVTNRIDSPDFSCAVHVSSDGGARWSRTDVPIPRGTGRKCYAPDAVFERDGTLRIAYVTLAGVANVPRAAWMVSSRDGGRSLSRPVRVAGPRAFQLRIAADPRRAGRLYASWVQARDVGNLKFTGPGNPIRMSSSEDGGESWRPAVSVNDPGRGRVLAPSPAVGARGELYVLYLDVGADRLDYEGGHEGSGGPPYPGRFTLVLARSRDRGRTWAESVIDRRIVPSERFISFLPPFPSLAVDGRSGRVYAAFHDARLGSADVWVWSLASGARGWSGPVRVNDTPRRDGTAQYLPRVAVAPGGRLDVVYYDRREDPRGDARNGVSLQSSGDGGRTFGPRVALAGRAFDSRIGFGSERGLPTLGSRLGLVSGRREALAAWSDTRAGTVASGKQDIVTAAAAAGRPGAPAATADDVGRAGFALVLGGLVALGLARRRASRR